MHATSPKSSDSWARFRARHLTKDLGAYSPREIHMWKPMSAHELYNRALLVGMPPCPTQEAGRPIQGCESQASLRQLREEGRLVRKHDALYETNVSQS